MDLNCSSNKSIGSDQSHNVFSVLQNMKYLEFYDKQRLELEEKLRIIPNAVLDGTEYFTD